MKLTLALAVLVLGGGIGWGSVRQAPQVPAASAAPAEDKETLGPGPAPLDAWHPAHATPVQPAYGGTLRVHTEALPPNLCLPLLNNTNARNMLYELHETLVQRDWESWQFNPDLAASWEVEDTLVTKDGVAHHGRVEEEEGQYVLAGTALAKDEVLRLERGTVFTFHLRPDVRWHDGHPFDAEDVLFSWRIAQNPEVRCDWVRQYYGRVERAEVVDAHTVRFFFKEQYFNALGFFVDHLTILPRHLYDLRDPDHPRHRANASNEECAKEINENAHNTEWVGLGPYKLSSYSQQGVEAERFAEYFDPAHGGYLDKIVWRHIANDEAAFQALVNGELDFTLRISSDRYFGEAMATPTFTQRFCKGYYYLGAFNYTPWNLRRPLFADLNVRKALAQAFDAESFRDTVAHGLAKLPTGPQCYFGPSYEHGVQHLPFDLARAGELLAEAGWYDRDGDGLLDKDGAPFEFEMLIQSGNTAGDISARMYQESLAKIGVRLKVTALDNASYFKRINERDFDAGNQSWSVDATENDPMQLWGSASAASGGSNHAGVIDPKVDALIARGARELDDDKRHALWRELHRYLYENVQPYLYRDAPPRKFALSQALRGVQFFKITPGYALRRWYYPAGTSGTRATREPLEPLEQKK